MGTQAEFVDTLKQLVQARRILIPPQALQDYNYDCLEDFALDQGTFVESAELTPDELDYIDCLTDLSGCDFRMKECFLNAQMLLVADFEEMDAILTYHEGIAVGLGVIPCLHAWVTINGKIVDLTWRTAGWEDNDTLGKMVQRILGVIPDGWHYLGVEVADPVDVIERLWETEWAVSWIDDHHQKHPLLQWPRKTSVSSEELEAVAALKAHLSAASTSTG